MKKQDEEITAALQSVIKVREERAEDKRIARKKLEKKQTELMSLEQVYREFSKLDKDDRKKVCSKEACEFLEKSGNKIAEYNQNYQEAINELKKLEARFGRKTVNLVVIGKIGAGKSKFLQSVSGLDDNCIPSFDGPSCTGITSVIENIPIEEMEKNNNDENWVETTFTFKTKNDILEDLRADIANVIKNSNSDHPLPEISDFDKIDQVLQDLESHGLNVKYLTKIYIDNRDEWIPYLDASKEKKSFDGDGLKASQTPDGDWVYTLTNNRSEIKKFVAKHDGKEKADRTEYYRYVAIKSALIRTKFPRISARIRLIDTVGIGDRAGDTEKRMETAINNDADGVIFVLDTRTIRTEPPMDAGVISLMEKFQKIYDDHKEQNAAHWMFFLINHERNGEEYLRDVARREFGGDTQILGSKGICLENQRAVDVKIPSEALKMVTDFLYQISKYLSNTDRGMEAKAKELQEKAEKCDAQFRSELAKIQIRKNANDKNSYIAGLTEERLCKLKETLEEYAQEIKAKENMKTSFLEESLELIQKIIDEEWDEKNPSQLQKIIVDCKKYWIGEKYRAAVFQKSRDKVRMIGARTPNDQEKAASDFKEKIASEITNSFGLTLDKMSNNVLNPITEKSPEFFQKISELILAGQYNSEDICSAFRSVDQFRLDTYNGITKALFNHFAALYIKDDPFADGNSDGKPKTPPTQPSTLESQLNNIKNNQHNQPNDKLLLETLKDKLRKFKVAVNEKANNEKYLVSESDQKYEELTHFIEILAKDYYSPWEKVFSRLINEGWINESEPDKERQKQVFEVAGALDRMIKSFRKS